MSTLGSRILQFFMPWACAGCRSALAGPHDSGFCGQCWLHIPRIEGLVCQLCGLPLKDGGFRCFSCRTNPSPILVRAATTYSGVIPPAIYRFKYGGRKTLSEPLSKLMRFTWDSYPELRPAHALVPVPLYRRNEYLRGFNQAELLASALAKDLNLPMLPLLTRTRKTHSQFALNRIERRQNVRAAFQVFEGVKLPSKLLNRLSILLIDDICTTTSTLGECAFALKRAGVASVKALVLARDL